MRDAGFSDWVDRQDASELKRLPLTHMSKAYVGRKIILADVIEPDDCDVAGKKVVYCFYGRPAYRASKDATVHLSAGAPYCFVLSPSVINRAKAIYPFDTGAFDNRMYNHVLVEEMLMVDFDLSGDPDRINRLVGALYGTPTAYFDGDKSRVPRPDQIAEDWEMAAQAYAALVASRGRNEPDDRIGTIELVFDHPLPLADNLLAVVVPHSHCVPEKEAPFLTGLREKGVDIIPYTFIPGKHPEYYQSLIESCLRDYYVDKGFLSE
jgi:hypothetical protein